MSTQIRTLPDKHRYELLEDGEPAAFVEYSRAGGVLDLVHTETLEGFTGRGLGGQLVGAVLAQAREQGWQVRPSCPFVRHYLQEHPEELDLVPESERTPSEE